MQNTFTLPRAFHSPPKLQILLHTKPERYWLARGEQRSLNLFHEMARRVPAYKDFLKIHHIHHEQIKTIDDFRSVPLVDKNNYLRAYPLSALCWDGKLKEKQWTIATTSGSTGEPFYFPREEEQDWQYAAMAELYLRNNFQIHKKSTLYIDGFAMGAWIGGLFTYQAIKHVSMRGNYQLSIITPGIFKREIIKAVKNLGDKFDQIIIGGYPPFIKDTIDDALADGIVWKKYDLGFIFSAEGFSEAFRDYILEKTGRKNLLTATLNHYGTVDLGTMAHETPLSILIRKLLVDRETLTTLFPHEHKQPTFAQYHPELFYFEDVDHELVCTAASGLPLVRYDLKDHGGIIHFRDAMSSLTQSGIDINKEIIRTTIEETLWNLPFVYVYERSDFTVKLYAANIYPETIRKALHTSLLTQTVTGKFTMEIETDRAQNQFLQIHVELKQEKKSTPHLLQMLKKIIIDALLKENSEYKSNYKESPERQVPHIACHPYEDPNYFPPGIKQKWVKK